MTQPTRRAVIAGSLGATAFAPLALGADDAHAAIAVPPSGNESYLLRIYGIPGESTISGHANEIELLDWKGGVSTAVTATSAASPKTRSKPSNLVFVHRYDKASPILMLACANGRHIPTATLTARRAAGDNPVDYLTITLGDVYVSSVQQALNAEDGSPLEQVSLNFGKVEVTYRTVNSDGSRGAVVKAGFDFIGNRTV